MGGRQTKNFDREKRVFQGKIQWVKEKDPVLPKKVWERRGFKDRQSAPVASMITLATSSGFESMGTWLVGKLMVVAFIFSARSFSSSGGIMRSCSATMYQD